MFLGKIDENFGSLVYGNLFKILGSNWNCFLGSSCYIYDNSGTNQYILENLLSFLTFKFDSILVMNLFMIFTIFISLFVFYKFFLLFIGEKKIAGILATALLFSPYFYYQLPLHYELSQVWIAVLSFYFLVRSKNLKEITLSASVNGLLAGFSTYLFIFYNVVLFMFLMVDLIFAKIFENYPKKYYLQLKNLIVFYLIITIVSLIVMFPFIYSNYYQQNNKNNFSNVSRNIDNFIIFSSRPWYFMLPSTDNPFFGEISSKLLEALRNKTRNYLFDNYFKSEHSAGYLGIINIFLVLSGLFLFIRQKNKPEKYNYLAIFTTLILILLISLPPVITIKKYDIYLPSYLLYTIFPMTRVLSRLGVFALLFNLILVGLALKEFKNKSPKFIYIFPVIVLVILAEFFIKINLTIYDKTPESISWVHENTSKEDIIAVYPINKSRLTIFWNTKIQRKIINPLNYEDMDKTFVANDFSSNLNTSEGINQAKKKNVKYLFVYKSEISKEDHNFFENSRDIEVKRTFEEKSLTKSWFCQNLTFIFKCIDASNLGEVTVYQIK